MCVGWEGVVAVIHGAGVVEEHISRIAGELAAVRKVARGGPCSIGWEIAAVHTRAHAGIRTPSPVLAD